MTISPDDLFDLLPQIYRRRDAERGYPLRALLQVIAEQAGLVEADIEQLYENWFIETCDDWVAPYIGELVGYDEPPDLSGLPSGAARAATLAAVLAPRRAVANTIRNRRRKGTLALLELLARDVADWPGRAVEFYKLLSWMQPLNHQRLDRGRTVDLRDGLALEYLDGPFDRIAHTVDVRRIRSTRTAGRYNIPSVGLFAWRLKVYSRTREPAYALEERGSAGYTFSVLGNDAPLFTRSLPEPSPHDIAGPLNLPVPISRRVLEAKLDAYYGAQKSFAIWTPGWPGAQADGLIPREHIVAADLSGWFYRPAQGTVAVDPELGRIAFNPRQLPGEGVRCSYYAGFSDDTGGGEYTRAVSQPEGAGLYRVGEGGDFSNISDALAAWRDGNPNHAVIEIVDGGVYTEQISIHLREGQSLQLRARNRSRTILRVMDWHSSRPDALHLRGEAGSRFTLDGVVLAGRILQSGPGLSELVIRHATLVPGWNLGPDCSPARPSDPGLELTNTTASVRIERSIVGAIQVNIDEVESDPIPITITDSILDGTSDTHEALGAPSWPLAHATLTIKRSTVFGKVLTHAIALAEDSIFTGPVQVARRQIGCMRFCYVPPPSRTPRRYRCQPDLVERAVRESATYPAVGEPVWVPVDVGGVAGGGPGKDPAPANLRLSLTTSNATPVIGETVTFIAEVANMGPRTVSAVTVTFETPVDASNSGILDMLDLELSQGSLDEENWEVGNLAQGMRARLTAVTQVIGVGIPPRLSGAFTAQSFVDDGSAYIEHSFVAARQRVRPRFTSKRYGKPGYAQLDLHCDPAILRGASDRSEMGAFHDLFQPQREDALKAQLDDFVPAGTTAGLIFSS